MSRGQKARYWCGRAQYPGKKPFIFGSAVVSADARFDQVLEALNAVWAEISPHEPPQFTPVPGIIIFQEEGES